MQIYLTHKNNIFEYCHASVLLDNVEVLYLEDGNLCIQVLKNNTATIFFSQETFSSSKLWISAILSWFRCQNGLQTKEQSLWFYKWCRQSFLNIQEVKMTHDFVVTVLLICDLAFKNKQTYPFQRSRIGSYFQNLYF